MLETRVVGRFATSCRVSRPSQRAFHVSRRCLAEEDEEAKKSLSFRGQVYVSTAQRLQQERARDAQFARERVARDKQIFSRSVYLAFGK